MVLTNFGGTGDEAIVAASRAMLLLCGPLDWAQKQKADGTGEPWGDPSPSMLRIEAGVTIGGTELSGSTGILTPTANPSFWAVAIPIPQDSATQEEIDRLLQTGSRVNAIGKKEYFESTFNDDLVDEREWTEALKLVEASAAPVGQMT